MALREKSTTLCMAWITRDVHLIEQAKMYSGDVELSYVEASEWKAATMARSAGNGKTVAP